MPSKSDKQARTMRAACKNPTFGSKVGIPKKVACEFMNADRGRALKRSKAR